MISDSQSLEAETVVRLDGLAISSASHVVVAVSGGLDSMVLLHLLSHLPRNARPQLTVAHLNHGLRHAESCGDQRMVQSICEQSQLPFVTKTLGSGQIVDAHKQTIEEAARSFRYQWLEEVALEAEASAIATGHHSDDQAETVLHHLTRGTGLRGLQGMMPERRLPHGIRLLRPFIAFSRQQLQRYADRWQIAFREDSTNADITFTRNKIRHQFIPQANNDTESQQNFSASLNQLASSAAETVRLLDQISENLARASIVTRTGNHVLIRIEPLRTQPKLIRSHFFTWLWIQQAWARQKMTATHWEKLCEAIEAPIAPRFQLPGRVDVIREGHWIRIRNDLQQ